MATYTVEIRLGQNCQVEVEADSKLEAVEKALADKGAWSDGDYEENAISYQPREHMVNEAGQDYNYWSDLIVYSHEDLEAARKSGSLE